MFPICSYYLFSPNITIYQKIMQFHIINMFLWSTPDEVASVWMPAKACHDFIMILLCFSIPDFIPHKCF